MHKTDDTRPDFTVTGFMAQRAAKLLNKPFFLPLCKVSCICRANGKWAYEGGKEHVGNMMGDREPCFFIHTYRNAALYKYSIITEKFCNTKINPLIICTAGCR